MTSFEGKTALVTGASGGIGRRIAERLAAAGGHGPGTREHVLVTQGALRTGPADRVADLRAGDYAGFTADEMHLYEAGPRGARALLIMQWATQS